MSSLLGVPLFQNLWMVWDFTCWQFNMLACHRFMDNGRRQKPSGLETKDSLLLTATGSLLLTSKAAAKVLAFLHQGLGPGFFCRAMCRMLRDILSGRRDSHRCGDSESFMVNKRTSYLPQREALSNSSEVIHYSSILEKERSVLCSQPYRNLIDPYYIFFPPDESFLSITPQNNTIWGYNIKENFNLECFFMILYWCYS